jgi:hypothetical protein
MEGTHARPTYVEDQARIAAACARLRKYLAEHDLSQENDDDLPPAPSSDETATWIIPGLVATDETEND